MGGNNKIFNTDRQRIVDLHDSDNEYKTTLSTIRAVTKRSRVGPMSGLTAHKVRGMLKEGEITF